MAKIPTYQSGVGAPGAGRGVRVNPGVLMRPGMAFADMASSVGKLSKDYFDQAKALTEAAEMAEAEREAGDVLDATTYQALQADTIEKGDEIYAAGEMKAAEKRPKGKFQGLKFDAQLSRIKASRGHIYRARREEKRLTLEMRKVEIAMQKALETGDRPWYNRLVASVHPSIGDAHANELLKGFEKSSEIEIARLSANDNPQGVLDFLQGLKDDKGLTKDQMTRIGFVEGVARDQKVFSRYQKDQQQQDLSAELWELSGKKNTTPTEIYDFVSKLPDSVFSLAEKDSLYKSTISRLRLIENGRGDPYTVRQDQVAFKELLFGAVDGTKGESDFRKAVNNHKITTGDYIYLNNAKKDVSSTSMVNVLRRMDQLIDESGQYGGGVPLDMTDAVKTKAQMILESRVNSAEKSGKALDGMALWEEMIMVVREVELEAANVVDIKEFMPINRSIEDAAKRSLGNQPRTLTIEEFEKLLQDAKMRGWTEGRVKEYMEAAGLREPK